MAKNNTVTDSQNDIDSSDFRRPEWKAMERAWKLTLDLWGSPLDIRDKGKEYLIQFNREPAQKFANRLESSVFENEFRGAIETMAGMVFRTDPKPDSAHPEIDALLPDIDLCGNSFWSFNLENFQKFLRDGNGFIYVDAPPLNEASAEAIAEGREPTLRDRANDRPFWVFYEASQVINWDDERVGSRSVLSQVTIEENTYEKAGMFGVVSVKKHRILRRGSFEVWKYNPDTKQYDIPDGAGTTGLEEIPLIPVDRFGSQPPMLTLAMLNVLYYNKTSDYDDICHLVCTPRQIQKYESKQDAQEAAKLQTASPGVGLKIWGKDASVFYAEVAGGGLDHAHERYKDIEEKMAALGVGMMAPTEIAAAKTAAEVMDTAGKRQSKLANYTRQWENAIEKALYFTALYINAIKGDGTIDLADAEELTKMRLKIDYDRLTFSIQQLQFFNGLVDSGKLSLSTFLHWLPQVADMPPGFDPEEEIKKIALEKPKAEPTVTDVEKV
jgi:hypothetical protein